MHETLIWQSASNSLMGNSSVDIVIKATQEQTEDKYCF